MQPGHGEYLGGQQEVDREEGGEDDDPGPDRQEGGDQAEAGRPVARVEEEEGRGPEVRQSDVEFSVRLLAQEVTLTG